MLQAVLFEIGEKTSEQLYIEKKREEELSTLKLNLIRTLIDKKLENSYQAYPLDKWPLIGKKINWEVQHVELGLFDQEE